jgi:MoaA/NifB/PqqE/SkfB family radical SAM enzyme
MNNDNFCALLWNGLEINASGSVRPCCFFNDSIRDGDREMNVAVDTIASIRNSDYLRDIRNKFIQGQKPEVCNQCWKNEAAGRGSERINANQRIKKQNQSVVFDINSKPLVNLGIALGNICNLKCRICGPWASSSWNADEIKLIPRDQLSGTIEERMLTQGAWPIKSDTFWHQFAEEIKTVSNLNIYGGEPFMIPKHFEMLKFLVDNNYAQNIDLAYNTNGTHFPEQAIELWNQFRQVHISLSIDNLNNKFEYERKNSSWNTLIENLNKFKKIQHKNIQLQCTVTVSAYNILDLNEIAAWVDQQEFDLPTFWNILQFSKFNSIAHLADQSKTYIIDKLTNNNLQISDYNKKNINNIIQYMTNNTPEPLEHVLIEEIRRVDQFRKEYLGDTHPELAQLIGYTKRLDDTQLTNDK